MPSIRIKRIYAPPAPTDGYRILVDRLWPRGMAKADAAIHEWGKDIAPSAELRTWFAHKAERFEAFCEAYRKELEPHADELARLKAISMKKTLTLLYAAKDPDLNQAQVLRDVLEQLEHIK